MSSPPDFPGPIEIAPSFYPRPRLRHAVFDWDGTISLIRGGWVDIMVDLALESGPLLDRTLVLTEMLALNGTPTVHQMVRLAELVNSSGGRACHPDEYLHEYGRRLARATETRIAALGAGAAADRHTVPGVLVFIDGLCTRGIDISLVSGTSHPELLQEAKLLGMTGCFGDRLHGPRDVADRVFTKRAAIHTLASNFQLGGDEILAVGDGPVEISEVKALGGLAIGIASDELAPGSRRFDAHKRKQLLDSGADIVVPDYLDADALLRLIFSEET